MKLHTLIMLIGCVLAVVTVKATDHYFTPEPERKWACVTDMECQDEEEARYRGERCIRLDNSEGTMICLPIDRH